MSCQCYRMASGAKFQKENACCYMQLKAKISDYMRDISIIEGRGKALKPINNWGRPKSESKSCPSNNPWDPRCDYEKLGYRVGKIYPFHYFPVFGEDFIFHKIRKVEKSGKQTYKGILCTHIPTQQVSYSFYKETYDDDAVYAFERLQEKLNLSKKIFMTNS